MKNYSSENLRNVAIMGHGGDGKTTLAEAMLFNAGVIDRMGRIEDGTATMDYDAEENKRQISISTALASFEQADVKVNIIDAPGYFDFVGEQVQALRLADSAVILISGVAGLSVGAEKAWTMCKDNAKAKMIFVNQMDRENANYRQVLYGMREKYGNSIVPVMVPIMEGETIKGYVDILNMTAHEINGKGYTDIDIPADIVEYAWELREMLVESAVESDDELMEKYFSGDELTEGEIVGGLRMGIEEGRIATVMAGSASQNLLIDVLMERLVNLMPAPTDVPAVKAKNGDNEVDVACDASGKFAAQVVKTVADPFVGKLSVFRVYSGSVQSGMSVQNMSSGRQEKVGTVYTMQGKKQNEAQKLIAGDIGAVAKMQTVNTGDTLCDASLNIEFPALAFPKPCISMAVNAKNEGDEEKVFSGLARLEEEDPTFKVEKDPDTLESVLRGMGELHLEVISKKLQTKFGVEADLKDPKIPYRETIRKAVKAEGRHKKQTGGHGQFGHVWIEFEPLMDGQDFEFVDKIVGGVVPRQYIPAVEKGLQENLRAGVLAGYPMTGIRATLYDGSYHSVDSSEMAFKTAARLALRKGCAEASPVLLEPIYEVSVLIPDEYMGDIIGDMNRRRGRIMGMNPTDDGLQEVMAEVPLAEMFKYATDLRSMSRARGSFDMNFVRYEEVPANMVQKVIDEAERMEEDED